MTDAADLRTLVVQLEQDCAVLTARCEEYRMLLAGAREMLADAMLYLEAEQERCAKVADTWNYEGQYTGSDIAAAIRALPRVRR